MTGLRCPHCLRPMPHTDLERRACALTRLAEDITGDLPPDQIVDTRPHDPSL